MSDHRKWLEEELAQAKKAIKKLESEAFGASRSPDVPTEQEARDLEYHYFKIAQIMKKITERG